MVGVVPNVRLHCIGKYHVLKGGVLERAPTEPFLPFDCGCGWAAVTSGDPLAHRHL